MSSINPDASSIEKAGPARKSSTSRKTIVVSAIAGFIILIGLVVGLGVGLTVGRRNKGSDTTDDTTTTGITNSTTSATRTNSTGLWQPPVGSPWQIVLLKALTLPENPTTTVPDVPIWDIDVYINNSSQIPKLHALNRKVICYFSAGTYESFRSDANDFPESVRGTTLDGYADEKWLDIRSEAVRGVIRRRIDYAASQGCDAIDPDNIDAYNNQGGGFGLTQQDSVDFIRFMSEYAAGRGMSTGLKNGGDILSRVLPWVAFSVNEQCTEFSECGKYAPMVGDGKPVFHIEYKEDGDICQTTGKGMGSEKFSTVFKHHGSANELDGFVRYCDGMEFTTPIGG